MEYLVIERSDEVEEYIAELFFIDDIKVAEKISDVVKRRIERAR